MTAAAGRELEGLPWWQSAVVYQVYPRSFFDSDGDGVGDLEGVRRHLDHLVWLGVDALWLSPVFVSPMADAGYDVADYRDVDPLFGDLAAFDRLLAEAHERGLRVLLDWVPNHTSDAHPWFVDSRSSRDSPRRDFYLWRDGSPERPPNNWRAAFGGPAWTWDDATGQWYLHLFLPQQPDLNWSSPAVRAEMHDVLRFWLARGVDGFRADVVHLIGKDPDLPDHPPERVGVDVVKTHDQAVTHELLRGIRAVLEEFPGERVIVGEVNLRDVERLARYHGSGDELHLVFNFAPMSGPWTADSWRKSVRETLEAYAPWAAWPTWVLSNHDNPRHRTRYGGSEEVARAAAVLLLALLPGTPFLYAGEELGLDDAEVPPERRVDPGGRDGCRAPIPWTPEPGHGWPTEPWLPFPPEAAARSAAVSRADPSSVAGLYRRLLAARRRSAALAVGTWEELPTPDGVLGAVRAAGEDRRVVLVSLTEEPREVPLSGAWRVEVASDGGGEGQPWDGRLGPSRAVVLAPG